jgi:hypothetical protein
MVVKARGLIDLMIQYSLARMLQDGEGSGPNSLLGNPAAYAEATPISQPSSLRQGFYRQAGPLVSLLNGLHSKAISLAPEAVLVSSLSRLKAGNGSAADIESPEGSPARGERSESTIPRKPVSSKGGYYGVTGNIRMLLRLRYGVVKLWRRRLQRRNRSSSPNWERFQGMVSVFPLFPARIVHSKLQ